MSFPRKVAIPMYAPYGVMVEYSSGVSATRSGVPSSDVGAFSGRGGFRRRIPFDPTR